MRAVYDRYFEYMAGAGVLGGYYRDSEPGDTFKLIYGRPHVEGQRGNRPPRAERVGRRFETSDRAVDARRPGRTAPRRDGLARRTAGGAGTRSHVCESSRLRAPGLSVQPIDEYLIDRLH